MSDKEFLEHYWETRHLHIKRAHPAHFQSLISIEAISRYLSIHSASYPAVQMVQSTDTIPVSDYTDSQRKINCVAIDHYFSNGATVVVSQAQQQFEPLAALCRDVGKRLRLRAQTNVYLSPPGNQGFRSHYDTHDVFILQVSGRKTFRFYPSDVELPFPDDKYDPEQNPHTEKTFN